MTMAHSVEGRVPFLDTSMIEFAQSIPPCFKLHGEPPVEKWILRKAFEDLLPSEIVWREKAQFDEGSGTADLLADVLTRTVSPTEVDSYRTGYPDADLRSAEECAYFRSFLHAFDDPQLVLSTVGRWSHRPL
jgi:asparagine synthase (glutamine-hydrolysing)